MKYEYSEAALNSLMNFSEREAEKIQDLINEAAVEEFYNYNSYSYIYDDHRNLWDKLDLKQENLNHRVFFTKINSVVFILDVFDRDNIEYGKDLYSKLSELDDEIRNNRS
ncbi:MAG: hypothetical protein BRC29_01920 [Nanohaloarchaea archaeon SW_7_43_1]|nr:MAG: hypothetical protein BRC29_01920 [Nanohaloarchaea archaeon SW_7_43_1]